MPYYDLSRNPDHSRSTLWKFLCDEAGDISVVTDKLWEYIVEKWQTVNVAGRVVWFFTTLERIEDIWCGWADFLKIVTYAYLREGGRP